MYAGYENCEIFRSEDGGETWRQLPVQVQFRKVTVSPGANPAKRVLMLAGSLADPKGGVWRHRSGWHHPHAGRGRTGKTSVTASI